MKHSLFTAAVIILPLLVSACNTVSGAGEDISKGGQSIEKSAEKNKHY